MGVGQERALRLDRAGRVTLDRSTPTLWALLFLCTRCRVTLHGPVVSPLQLRGSVLKCSKWIKIVSVSGEGAPCKLLMAFCLSAKVFSQWGHLWQCWLVRLQQEVLLARLMTPFRSRYLGSPPPGSQQLPCCNFLLAQAQGSDNQYIKFLSVVATVKGKKTQKPPRLAFN